MEADQRKYGDTVDKSIKFCILLLDVIKKTIILGPKVYSLIISNYINNNKYRIKTINLGVKTWKFSLNSDIYTVQYMTS